MRRWKTLVNRSGLGTLAALTMLVGCAATRDWPAGETITVSRRPWFAVCAGVCPNYDVTVQADGRVWAVRHASDRADLVVPIRMSQARLARFRSLLAPFRPGHEYDEPDACRHHVAPDEEELVVNTLEIEIKWSTKENSDHLIACDTPENLPLRAAIDAALASLGLGVDGLPPP